MPFIACGFFLFISKRLLAVAPTAVRLTRLYFLDAYISQHIC